MSIKYLLFHPESILSSLHSIGVRSNFERNLLCFLRKHGKNKLYSSYYMSKDKTYYIHLQDLYKNTHKCLCNICQLVVRTMRPTLKDKNQLTNDERSLLLFDYHIPIY